MPLIMIPMLYVYVKKYQGKKKRTKLQTYKNDHIKLLYIAKKYQLCMVNINTAKKSTQNPQKIFLQSCCIKK